MSVETVPEVAELLGGRPAIVSGDENVLEFLVELQKIFQAICELACAEIFDAENVLLSVKAHDVTVAVIFSINVLFFNSMFYFKACLVYLQAKK